MGEDRKGRFGGRMTLLAAVASAALFATALSPTATLAAGIGGGVPNPPGPTGAGGAEGGGKSEGALKSGAPARALPGPARGGPAPEPPAMRTSPVPVMPARKKPIQITPALIHSLQQALLKTNLTKEGMELNQATKEVTTQISRVSVSLFNYKHQAEHCSKKTYTTEDQKLAGCLGGDTLDQCSSKLFNHCVDAARKKFHGDRNAMMAAQDHLANALNAYNVKVKMIP